MEINNSELFKELHVEATITKFTYWLRNHIIGLIHSLSWQAVGGSRPEIIITNPNIKTSISMDQAWFDIDLAWGKDESGKRNEEGKIIISVKQTGQLLFLRADYSNIVLEDFVSNILFDVLNKFPPRTVQDSNRELMRDDDSGTLSSEDRDNFTHEQPEILVPSEKKPTYYELSDDEKLCLAWVNRAAFPYQNMEEFLNNASNNFSKAQFKRMLRKYSEKGLLVKVGNRWKSATDYH